jgi:hypothetical protein
MKKATRSPRVAFFMAVVAQASANRALAERGLNA